MARTNTKVWMKCSAFETTKATNIGHGHSLRNNELHISWTSMFIRWMEEILHRLGQLKPYKYWDKPSINWCMISSIHRSCPVSQHLCFSNHVDQFPIHFPPKNKSLVFRSWLLLINPSLGEITMASHGKSAFPHGHPGVGQLIGPPAPRLKAKVLTAVYVIQKGCDLSIYRFRLWEYIYIYDMTPLVFFIDYRLGCEMLLLVYNLLLYYVDIRIYRWLKIPTIYI